MKKLLLFLLVMTAILGGGLYVASGPVLAKVSDRMIDYLVGSVQIPGVEYARPSFGAVRLASYNAVVWSDVSLDARLMRNEAFKTIENISLKIDQVTLRMEDFSERAFLLGFDGFHAAATVKGGGPDPARGENRMEGGHLEIPLRLTGFGMADILAQLDELREELPRFLALGVTGIPISFSAVQTFDLNGKPFRARFSVEQKGGEYRLVMDRNDLQKIAALLPGQKPNPIELEVIARNPIKAQQLLKIRDKAVTTAQLAARQDPKIPEDAYRHTLWSYLLARMYGEPFAKEVTDAHEAYADEEELKKADRISFNIASYQDLVNNAAGRQYAAMGYPESTILDRVMTDPAVIRDHEAVKRFNAAEYEKLKPVALR